MILRGFIIPKKIYLNGLIPSFHYNTAYEATIKVNGEGFSFQSELPSIFVKCIFNVFICRIHYLFSVNKNKGGKLINTIEYDIFN